ncbi:uncharacterized protein N7500_007315 [Penicillium coprophilum]|uniref:uncharacterized protein n=1 Tax=Penicillium coprophilum TaxID=36646 RepID=UPI00239300E7|nr:uncharacterized protein N7500_007315 [Penicillium coprophilum]KAJ5165485.1 hypothetical protein N7500_007315 [Penicillium coprophilum]
MSCIPYNVYTRDDRDQILEATASAIDVVYCLTIGQHGGQDREPHDLIDVFQKISQQHPDDSYLTSLVDCAFQSSGSEGGSGGSVSAENGPTG